MAGLFAVGVTLLTVPAGHLYLHPRRANSCCASGGEAADTFFSVSRSRRFAENRAYTKGLQPTISFVRVSALLSERQFCSMTLGPRGGKGVSPDRRHVANL